MPQHKNKRVHAYAVCQSCKKRRVAYLVVGVCENCEQRICMNCWHGTCQLCGHNRAKITLEKIAQRLRETPDDERDSSWEWEADMCRKAGIEVGSYLPPEEAGLH